MKPTLYVDMIGGRLRNVRCMKCNTFLYDVGDAMSMRSALAKGLPNRAKVALSDGSYTDVVLCMGCKLDDSDLPKMEATMKYGLTYEAVKAGRPLPFLATLAKQLRSLKMLRRL